jgi:hypothetical protein
MTPLNPTLRTMLAQSKSLLVIGLVSVLIWLLAEAESLRTEQLRVEVNFRAGSETARYIHADTDVPTTFTVRLQGSTARVDTLASQLRKPVTLEPGMTGIPVEPGRHAINLLTVLRDLPVVRESGVSIADVQPGIVSVSIDTLAVREAKVRIVLPAGALVEGTPEPTRPTVELRYPESAAKDLPKEITLDAPIDPEALTGLPENRRVTIPNIRVELPEPLRGVEGARVIPSSVGAQVTLRSRTGTYTIPSVPVHVRLAPTETGIWDITMPAESRLLTDVTVSGPSDYIDQIRADKVKPIAFIPLSFEELERAAASGEPIEKAPVFTELPSQLKFDPKQRTVKLTVKRRELPASSPAGPDTNGRP